MEQVLRQARATRANQQRNRMRIAQWGGGAACMAVLMLVSLALSSVGDLGPVTDLTWGGSGLAASVFAGSSMHGYLIVGILGAVLGVALTVLVYRLGHSDSLDASARQDDREW